MAEKSKKKNMRKAFKADGELENQKKPSMKTATDVISRLLWDESLPQDKFTVGYLDRFDGIMEKSFDSLDWRDPATVDYHCLALPKHRIQYFKYLNKKVWDKKSRKDIVFGSTGYPLSIYEFMSRVDNDISGFHDEDIETEYCATENKAMSDASDEILSDDESEAAGRPNFFIAARIQNEDTVRNLKVVSDYIKSKDELLSECCIAPEIFHMTFSILKLDSPSDVCTAIEALQALAAQALPPVTLNLQGLDNFKHRVLYSNIEDNEALMDVRKRLMDELVSRKVIITDRFSFVPHVTVAKLSRPVARLRHSKFIDQYLYLKFEDNEFGTDKLNTLYLCEMGTTRRDDGFYKCAYEATLK